MKRALKTTVIKSTFLFLMASTSSFPAHADIIDGKYGVNQVFDVQRSPAYPIGGQPFNLSSFVSPLRDNITSYDIGTGYIQFYYTGDPTYQVGIKLYDQGGNFIETISTQGQIYGLSADGFLYDSDPLNLGTFVSNNTAFALGDSTSYTPAGGLASLNDLQNYVANMNVLSLAPPIRTAVDNQGNVSGRGAATVLETFLPTDPDAGIAAVATAFAALNTDAEISDAVSQTLPLLNGAQNAITQNSIRTITNVIQARQETTRGISSGDDALTGKNFWFKPLGSLIEQDNKNGVTGYDAKSYGVVTGIDAPVTDKILAGVGFSYINSNVDSNSSAAPQHSQIDTYQLIGYGSYALDNQTEIYSQMDFGYNKNDGKRDILLLGTTARAEYDSWSAHVGTGVSRVYQAAPKLSFIPSARIDYTWIRAESYNETGAGVLNQYVSSQTDDELLPSLEAKIKYQATNAMSLSAKVGGSYDILNDGASITSAFAGSPAATFTTQGLKDSPWTGKAGAGLDYKVSDTLDLSINYDAEVRTSYVNQSASFKARFSF